MPKKYDLPAMPWYVGDWLKCPEVRALAPDYRGLWFDLICYMWESTERGVMIKPNGQPYSDKEIIRMVGLDNQNTGLWLTHLLDNGICFRRDDGCIYSKRMIRDEEIRIIRHQVGSKGGNPLLLVNHQVNQNIETETANENEPKTPKTSKQHKEKKAVSYVKDNPPSVEEVAQYCRERNNGIDAQAFVDKNTTIGWLDKNKIPYRDWKAVIRTWENFRKLTTVLPVTATKRPVGIVVVEKIAAGMDDRSILIELVGKYTEHDINEALMHAHKDVR